MVFLGAPPAPGPARFTRIRAVKKDMFQWGKYGENMRKIWGKYGENDEKPKFDGHFCHGHSWGYGWRA